MPQIPENDISNFEYTCIFAFDIGNLKDLNLKSVNFQNKFHSFAKGIYSVSNESLTNWKDSKILTDYKSLYISIVVILKGIF